ncbi:MAG: VOC family protein [Burkholderiaceae bacterium]
MAIPYIHFQGNCHEAMSRYAEILGGGLEIMPYSQAPADAPEAMRSSDLVMHCALNSPEFGTLFASDYPPGHDGEPQASVSISIGTPDTDKARAAFEALAEGGTVMMPFERTFFAAGFGMARDRFGTTWMVMAQG